MLRARWLIIGGWVGVACVRRVIGPGGWKNAAASGLIRCFVRWPWVILILLAVPLPALAAEEGEELTISVMTFERGDEVFEKFAHNTIWVHDANDNSDIVYNWGLFDFNQKRFFVNFALGHLNYSMGGFDLQGTINWYKGQNRSIWVQELNLTPAQRVKMRDFLRWNEQPENANYQYNYFMDNCSTRVRDAIDRVTDGNLKRQLDRETRGKTFRSETSRVTRDDVLWYTAFNLVFGPATDVPITAWGECFLPIQLHDRLRDVIAYEENGKLVPLVKSERTLFESNRGQEPQSPPNWIVQYFLVGVAVAAGMWGLSRRLHDRKAARVTLGLVMILYSFLIGLCGVIGLFFWLFTDHWAAWRNENLFGYSPVALPLVLLVPLLMRRSKRAGRLAMKLAMIVAISTILGIVAQVLPWLNQVNGEPMALVLPINLAMAYAVWRYSKFVNQPSSITNA